jgi:mRNA interferase MazF
VGRIRPAVGSEIRKQRPAVIVSNDSANKHLDRVQVVPLTTSIGKVYSSEAVVICRGKEHKALADQIMTADKSRFINRIGRCRPKIWSRLSERSSSSLA